MCENIIWSFSFLFFFLFHLNFMIYFFKKDLFCERTQQTFVGLKTSWRRLQDMSWRRLQQVFSVTILRLSRRLEDVLKTYWRRLAKTSWRCLEDVFKTSRKTSWRHVLKTSWRHILETCSRRLGGKQNFYWWYLYLTNLNVYQINLCFTNYISEI